MSLQVYEGYFIDGIEGIARTVIDNLETRMAYGIPSGEEIRIPEKLYHINIFCGSGTPNTLRTLGETIP